MRGLKRCLLSLPFLLIAFGMAAGCHSTVPSLLLTIEDPTGVAPTQLRVTVSVEELETHNLKRPEVPAGPLASPQTLRLFMPDEAVGRRVDLTVEALRDDVVVGSAVTVTVLKAVEDTQIEMSLVPASEPEVCDATTCPFGCCNGNVCVEGDLSACGAGGGACNACDTTSTDQCVEGSCRCGADAPCPTGYRCQEGACAPSGEGQSCTVSEQCNAAPGQCFEAQGTCGEDGKCSYAPKPTTEGCDDKNSCTDGDHCDGAGVCVSTPKACNGPTGQCLEDVGECVNGTCRYDPLPGTQGCDDNNRCTDSDTCDGAGSCKGTPKSCSNPPNLLCWEQSGTCADGSCTYTQKQVGTTCGTGDACTAYTCNAAGQCVSSPKVTCDNPGQCRTAPGTCNPQTGACSYEVATGAACDDGNACTVSTTCNSAGACGGGSPKCTTSNPCQYVAGCDPATGNCDIRNRPSGYSCGAESECSERVCNGTGTCIDSPQNDGEHCGGLLNCRRCMSGTCASMCGANQKCCHGEVCSPSSQPCGIPP